MLAEIAVFALCIALCCSLVSALALFRPALTSTVPITSQVSAAMIFFAFAVLIILRMDSDFTVANVADHSNRALPLLYKITGAWGNHEGSMLLFALVMAGFGAMLAHKTQQHKDAGLQNSLFCVSASLQSALLAGILLFILTTSNPFTRIFPPPAEGRMLNPLLQDMALAIHPPLLYLGYVGFSSVFSLVVSGLITRKIDSDWARMVHPWIMFSWSTLTIGIALGSWWAYRELGWGGFWFWDPVENASLLPWLAGTALLHSNIVLKKRSQLASWVALLSIITFGLSLLGTFLVRSGAITSVHSFASDPARGIYILAYLALTIGGGLALYSTRIGSITQSEPILPASREGLIVINNLFLLTVCATVLLGTLYPMLAELIYGTSVTVGAPYFNATFLPMMALCLIFAGIAAFLPWKNANLTRAISRAWPAWSAAVAVAVLVAALVAKETLIAAASFALATFLMVASSQWIKTKQWSVFLGHLGAAVVVIGITSVSLWTQSKEGLYHEGDSLAFAGYVIDYERQETIETPNHTATRVSLRVRQSGADVTTLTPEFRRYALAKSTTSETAIYTTAAYDLYAVIGETNEEGSTPLRLYHKPSISFIWIGALLMTCGGLCSIFISSSRLRENRDRQ